LGLESDSHCFSFTRSLFDYAALDVVMEIEPSPHVMDKEGLGEVDILAARPV
jgi:hypothetical protein